MKNTFFLGAAVVMVALFKFVPIVDCYATRYDHIDVDQILNNRRMVNYYASCLLNKGPCPPQGVELKRILPEALQTNCEFCTDKQKTVAYRSIKRLKKEYPKIWRELSDQWDPDGAYIKKFEETFEANLQNKPTTTTTTTSTISSSTSTTSSSTTTVPPSIILNRFGDEEESNVNTISTNDKPSPTTKSIPKMTSTTTTPSTPASSTTKTARTTTKKPTSSSTNKVTTKRPPLSSFGTNIQATVSYGVNVFNGIVNGLGELGRGVVETGARLADAVVSAVVGVNKQ